MNTLTHLGKVQEKDFLLPTLPIAFRGELVALCVGRRKWLQLHAGC